MIVVVINYFILHTAALFWNQFYVFYYQIATEWMNHHRLLILFIIASERMFIFSFQLHLQHLIIIPQRFLICV